MIWPDLQKLVEKYGTYSAIPADAWTEFDRQAAECQRQLRQGLPGTGTKSSRR